MTSFILTLTNFSTQLNNSQFLFLAYV